MSKMIASGTLTTTIANGIATLTFGHPASNSFPKALLQQLTTAIQEVSANDAVQVVVLKSEGTGVFCAGASFDELLAVSTEAEGAIFFSGFAHVINAMRACPKVIIGRIQGKAIGGGFGIAAACDYTLGTRQASIKLSELAIGIGPFVIEPAVSRKIGKMAMSQMTLAAQEWKSAEWAHQQGLYAAIFETLPDLDEAVQQMATQLASYHPQALLEIKKVFWEGTDHWATLLLERAAISGQLVLSDFTKNALLQFKK
ncbi:enoyl-CoA hydratase/isomerase family protein [Flavobacterium sp.]|jgi:methylglutaconyl-CoA hydratase|uniref:enoyl-CoA hydratase/isomerase family protein n=1 Tax=Flavobacterium sp. TaxID=239 RepID=UPI0022C770D3|nr:enoyl-CoA hydratase/isomerase family protein [Flavobacterium sp.]MCZ8229018.1 enoyl-CoA hydratase/isomerase family protein [Flavobacterium sp.]